MDNPSLALILDALLPVPTRNSPIVTEQERLQMLRDSHVERKIDLLTYRAKSDKNAWLVWDHRRQAEESLKPEGSQRSPPTVQPPNDPMGFAPNGEDLCGVLLMMNHNCEPNTGLYGFGDLKFLHAARPLGPGEEITVS
ncbi:hypothetical protein Q5752_003253 [Cryptotrichosporon argae]